MLQNIWAGQGKAALTLDTKNSFKHTDGPPPTDPSAEPHGLLDMLTVLFANPIP